MTHRSQPTRTNVPPPVGGVPLPPEVLALLCDAVPLGICLLGADQTIVFVNRTATRLFRQSSADCIGKSLLTLIGQQVDLSDSLRATGIWTIPQVAPDLSNQTQAGHDEHQEPVPSIVVEWQQLRVSGIPSVATLLTLRDLSREIELEKDRDRLAEVAEESPYPIVEIDRHGNLVYVNPAMADVLCRFGYDLAGKPDILPDDLPALAATCLLEGRTLTSQDVVRGEACFSWTLCPVPSHELVRAFAIDLGEVHATHRALNDIADRLRESNRQLDQALQQAQAAARAKSAFLAMITHELRTPMNGVIGMASLMLDTSLTEEQRSFTHTIQQCGEAQLSLINDVLECSKIEAGKLELENIDFQLRTTVEDVLAQFAERAQRKGLEITGLVHAAVPNALRGDPGRLRQILTNFVGNAIKFTERGEVTLQAFLESDSPSGVTIRFEVTDSGIGISEDVQARLFQAFTQADSSTTRKYGGTGLGLAISKQLVELMRGKVGLRSKPGQGTTFWCTALFQKQAVCTPAIVPSVELSGRRILIVDDNESNRRLLHHLVSGWGMLDGQARDADEALQMLEQAAEAGTPYDAAVLDMLMPGKDGLQLAQDIRAHRHGAGVRLIVLTSLIQPGHAERARRAGFTAYLTKPVRHDQLLGCLRVVFGLQPHATFAATSTPAESTISPSLITRHTLAEQRVRPRVLVAEDNVVNQKLAVRMLERLGYQPDVVSNGQEAVAAFTRETYAAIVMDCQMPTMDGYEATRHIREEEQRADSSKTRAHVPIIALTANAMPGDRERCKASGMDDYLAKPVKTDDLGRILERWVPLAPLDAAPAPIPPREMTKTDASVFDASTMLANIGGDVELFDQLIRLFLERHRSMVQEIETAIKQGNAVVLERAAHSLKGTAGNLCAPDVVLLSSQLEAIGRLGTLAEAPTLLAQLERTIQQLVVVLTRQITPNDSSPPS
ncbi:MAG: response regulator [Nitrospira sp.]|nr:response regulator [Nitrospira sp.]MBP6605562.1 response regulator [Nitrospira sp.]HQY57540.1 response regulator [Nitrospira sp.]HRA95423.1 response regulator [Nitrospira sp.]